MNFDTDQQSRDGHWRGSVLHDPRSFARSAVDCGRVRRTSPPKEIGQPYSSRSVVRECITAERDEYTSIEGRKDLLMQRPPGSGIPGAILNRFWLGPGSRLPRPGAFLDASGANLDEKTPQNRPISRNSKREEKNCGLGDYV